MLAAHHAVHVRGPDARQIGLDPASGMVLEDLSPAIAAMLDELGPAAVGSSELLERAGARGAEPADAAAVLSGLLDGGLVCDASGAGRVERRRAGSVVVVRGDGPLALGTAAGLAAAGVGAVHVKTAGRIDRSDLAVAGLVADDVGRDRSAVASALLHRVSPSVRTGSPGRNAPDLVVLADAQARHPDEGAALVGSAVEHLAVHLRDGRGVVGPLVLPGRSACLGCLDLVRTGLDPGWPGVVAGLLGRTGTAEQAVIGATVALAVAQALLALDGPVTGGPPPPTLGATVELDPARASVTTRRWDPHPGCPCGAPPPGDAPCGATAGRGTIPG
ncbi:bacteriocin biosynthesis cyclodehydratase domain-containing protein [Pseudonocardia endophytica]|uniref:Bacteriocin biosynthesis cyclodehydratase domain-containing protein n=1 Tax=Pseudonocardia endophytica TaxID=401976 RepID=A0A4R1I8D7_PSEEN|nr:bacteriocin biosynthesis cyclodehydratase domain-containing protein [Pseudonocardia endophytica]